MKFRPDHAWGFQNLDKFQNEIVDGTIKKRWVTRPRVWRVKDFHEAKNFW